MKLGLGVEILKALIGNVSQLTTNPIGMLASLPRYIDCNLTAFLISYSGLYRVCNGFNPHIRYIANCNLLPFLRFIL